MPTVLHVLPPDAALACYGPEDWIDTSAAFTPLVVDGVPAHAPRPGLWQRAWQRLTRRPAQVDTLSAWLAEQDVAIVHLHTLHDSAPLCAAAQRRNIPVVLSWPRDGGSVAFESFARVLAPSPIAADRLLAEGCPSERLRIAPPPLVVNQNRPYHARSQSPLRWVTAGARHELASLHTALDAFARVAGEARLSVVIPPLLETALRQAIADRNLQAKTEIVIAENATALRLAFADAHFGLFPALPAGLGTGVPFSVWMAAASGLPCVLGESAAADGFLHQQQALLAAPSVEAIASQMAFLSARPYIWLLLGTAAATSAGDRLAYDRACKIPFEVYRQVLSTPLYA
ncbi:MAG TPA: hypothetical protein V6D47_01000 [Oscillatoriaceae cyanobacterium]